MRDYIFINQDINVLKDEVKSSKQGVFNRLIDQCATYFNVDLPKVHPKLSTTFMGIAMANLSLVYILTNEDKYLYEAKRWIFTCVNYAHWGNAHLVDVDLSAAWILFGMGISYDWLKGALSIEEKQKVKDKIILQGNRMYDYKIANSTSGWSIQYCQNHNWINLTGLSCAGYALINDGCGFAQEWIDDAKKNFETVYDLLPDDGSDYEGVVYWRYGAMWLFVYAHLLKEREGIDYFRTCKFLENTFFYRLYQCTGSLEEQMNFGDCHDTRSGHSDAIYYKVASEYNNPYAQKMGNLVRDEFLMREATLSKVKPGILPECFFEALFYDNKVEERDFSNLPTTRYFDDLGLYSYRSSWSEDAVCFSFKCSYPGGKIQWNKLWDMKETTEINSFGLSHQHPDNNSFLLTMGDTYFAIDDGYNRNVMAEDHNIVLVDSLGYEDEGNNNIWRNYSKDMIGQVEKYEDTDDYTYVVGESAKTYKKELKLNAFRRHLINTKKPYFIMVDELSSEIEHKYTWVLNSSIHPKFKDTLSYKIDNKELDLYHYSNMETEIDFNKKTIRAVMTTQEPDKFTETDLMGLHISNKVKAKDTSFVSVLIPRCEENKGIKISKIQVIGGYGVKIEGENTSKVIIYSKDNEFIYDEKEYRMKLAIIKLKDGVVSEVFSL